MQPRDAGLSSTLSPDRRAGGGAALRFLPFSSKTQQIAREGITEGLPSKDAVGWQEQITQQLILTETCNLRK